jgi:hypothetical protein
MDVFSLLPDVTYNNRLSKNILSRASFVRDVLRQYEIYYPYDVKEWERPDTIAYDYYGNSDYEWLVCIPNQVFDIPRDWVKNQRDFYNYLKSSYGSVDHTKITIHHYKYTGIGGDTQDEINRKSWKMSAKTYDSLDTLDKSGWTPVYVFDYENQINEDKRKIKLLSNIYLSQINRELKALFND